MDGSIGHSRGTSDKTMKIPRSVRLAFPAAALSASLLTAAGQTATPASPKDQTPPAQGPVVASAVGAITLPVTVVNDKGDPVKNLAPADLKLTDNGSAQTIQSFSPATTTPMDFGIIGQTSSGLHFELGDMRLASVHFVDHTLPGSQNQYFVVQYASEVDLLADPGKAQDKLHDAVNQLGSPQFGSQNNGGDSSDQSSTQSHSRAGGTLYDAIYLSATEEMKKLPGQHVLVIITDGIDHDSKETMTDAIEAAQNAHTTIFAIYYKSEEEQQNQNNNNRHGGMGGNFPGGSGYPGGGGGYPGGGSGRRGGQTPSDQPHEDGKANLEHICTATGGYMVEGKRDKADESYNKLVDLLKNQYTLTFVPTKEAADSDFQRISLTTEKKGVYPLVQQGYTPQQ
jgi:VWFA-related protein